MKLSKTELSMQSSIADFVFFYNFLAPLQDFHFREGLEHYAKAVTGDVL